MKTSRSGSSLKKIAVFAPIVLEIISLVRRSKTGQRSKYSKARKRDRTLDFLLAQAQKRFGATPTRRR